MEIYLNLNENDNGITNIGIAKALTECNNLEVGDIKEIADYLIVYANSENNKFM